MFDYDHIDLKAELEKIKKDQGKQRKQYFDYYVNHINKRYGADGYEKVLRLLSENGFEIPELSDKRAFDWIASTYSSALMVGMAKAFNYKREDFIEMGKELVAFNTLSKWFIKFFVSPKKTIEFAVKNWHRNFSYGRLTLEKYDIQNKTVVLRLWDFDKHPISCDFTIGFFIKMSEIILYQKPKKVEETKCIYQGDEYHEFVIKW